MTKLQQTSLESWEELQKTLGARQKEVLEAIRKLKACTNTMVSDYLKLPINCVTGRTRELYLRGLITEDHTANCLITGKKAIFWRSI